MFETIKAKIMLILSGLLASAGIAIKFLLRKNKDKAEKIEILEENTEIKEKIHKSELKHMKFDAKQEQKANKVNDESELDRLDAARGKMNDKDDDYTTITR